MTTIQLTTVIKAPIQDVFELARDITFHETSASQTKEKAIAGVTSGPIGLNETVTWRGKHFGMYLKHTSKIIEMTIPYSFTDVMIKGYFTYFCHKHTFQEENGTTLMNDILKYKVPYTFLGRIFDILFLEKHMTSFLIQRNKKIKYHIERK